MPDVKPEPGDLLVILRPAEEGGYIVLSPDIPGLITEGESVPHALSMAADAAEGLERAKRPRRPLSEVFAEIGRACGGAFDGVDPAKYVAEGRGEEPPGEWSAKPPTVPGAYWWRLNPDDKPEPREVRALHGNWLWCDREPVSDMGGEWWSVPIQPPGAAPCQ
jgi:predicted RNase H-like HicB family nuclease